MSNGMETHVHGSSEVEALTARLEAVAILDDAEQDDGKGPICCICHDPCVNPVRLPCQHVFCYLCIKGVATRSRRCALCRQLIPPDFIEKPTVVNKDAIKAKLEEEGDGYHWFYEAKNGGWWMYEERTSLEIEKAYSDEEQTIRLQISGFTYVVDFSKMVQYREHFPNRRRKIKRDVVRTDSVKGVAGIYVGGGETGGGEGGRESRGRVSHRWSEPTDSSSGHDPQPRLVTGEGVAHHESEPTESSSGHDPQPRLVTGEGVNHHESEPTESFSGHDPQPRLVTGEGVSHHESEPTESFSGHDPQPRLVTGEGVSHHESEPTESSSGHDPQPRLVTGLD